MYSSFVAANTPDSDFLGIIMRLDDKRTPMAASGFKIRNSVSCCSIAKSSPVPEPGLNSDVMLPRILATCDLM